MQHYRRHRFSGAAGRFDSRWHAVDLNRVGLQMPAAETATGSSLVEVASVCGARAEFTAQLGPFAHNRRGMYSPLWCERCGWVVALSLGTVEQEIDYYTADSTAHSQDGPALLRRIFTAILADAPAERDGEAGDRSDLLARAARHRPTSDDSRDPPASHGPDVCGECRVAAPCAVLVGLAFDYGIIAGEHS